MTKKSDNTKLVEILNLEDAKRIIRLREYNEATAKERAAHVENVAARQACLDAEKTKESTEKAHESAVSGISYAKRQLDDQESKCFEAWKAVQDAGT